MILAHDYGQFAPLGAIAIAEPVVLVAVRMDGSVFLPEQEQGDALVLEILLNVCPVGGAADRGRQLRRCGERQSFEARIVQIGRQGQVQPGRFRPAQVLSDRGKSDAATAGTSPIAQVLGPLEAQDFFDLTHG